MNHAEIIHIEVKYFLLNTARKTTIIWLRFYRYVYMLRNISTLHTTQYCLIMNLIIMIYGNKAFIIIIFFKISCKNAGANC